ncbi:hypothetical protein DL764_010890 [Monosporascus ibericus]|uniref:PRA1 family protein n=1 Tax=Monosporascus ibericus TaxID=155417 RepID=A0A4Q4SRZ3_9PEZI|nr:hypothetical protein DL764_010890 [Monosporascus ibericus]
MDRIQIPIDILTSRLNIADRFSGFRNTSISSRFANMRPVGEFLDFKRLSKPENFTEVQSRVNYNLGTFSSNYALVFVLLSVYALITNPLLLFDIILLVGGLWLLGRLNGQDLIIGTFHATSSQLYTGLLVTCGLLFLIASPFSTVLWLIGASGVVILGHAAFMDKPIDEAFSGEASKGIDLGSGGRSRRGYSHQQSDDDSTENESAGDSEEDTEDETQIALRESEEALVQSALARIRKAQAKGKQDVRLNKEELAALERRRKRLQAEAAKKKRASSSNGDERRRRKEKEQRYAVPLSRFDTDPTPQRGSPPVSDDSLPRHPSPATFAETQERLRPPKGLFPPPRSTSSHRPPSGHEGSSPFDYQYVKPPPNSRHASEPSVRPRSYYAGSQHQEDLRYSSSSSRRALDPFRFQTEGPPASAPYPSGSADVLQSFAGPQDVAYGSASQLIPSAARNSQGTMSAEQTSEEEEVCTGGDVGSGVYMSANRSRDEVVVVEASPVAEPERSRAKKSSSKLDPIKRRPVSGGGTSSSRRRKGK